MANPDLSFIESLNRSYETDLSPVLFNLVLKYSFKIFGYTPEIGRYISVISGCLGVYFLSLICYQISKHKTLNLVLFLSFLNIYLITYSAETRAYSTIFLICAINLFLFFKLIKKEILNKKFYIIFFLISVLTLLIHPFTMLIFGSQLIFLLAKDIKNKKLNYKIYIYYFAFFFLYILFGYENLKIALNFKPPEFFISQPNLKFFIDFYFAKFFGSKIMGAIYLSLLIYLIFYNFKKIVKNKYYLFLLILLLVSFFIPIIYGLIFNPILKDRYIIFVLIPILVLITNLIYEIENKKIRVFLLYLVLVSTITNHYFEIYNKDVTKPNYKEIFNKIDYNKSKNLAVIAMDKIHPYMTDVKGIDFNKERNIVENYLFNLDPIKNNFSLVNQNNLKENVNKLWLICQKPMVDDCEKNIRIKKDFEVIEKKNSYKIETYLLRKKSSFKK